jgi:subfamily B ATP-binding cassette protein MsbA
MQLAALRKVQELSVAFFQKRPVSDLVARINGDTRVIYTAMTTGFIDTIREPFSLLGILASMLWVDWKLTLISLGLLPVIIWPVAKSGRRLKEMAKSFARQNVQQSGGILEALMAVRVVKAYSMEAAQRKNFLELANQTVALNVKQAQIKSMLNPVIEVISMVGIGFLILFVFYTATCPTNFVTFVAALLLTPLSIKRLADLHLTLQTASVSSERLEELFSEQPTVVEPARPQILTKFSQGICIENVTFSYGHTDVLHKVSLEIPKGKKIGLAGESGSGKSTLINLIMRFYDPTQGRILLDGHDLREYATKDLLAQMGMVSQDVVLFNLPVGKNIGLGHEGATQAEIEQAAKHAYAHDFILQMPQGYESPCGERGQLLSGGQKARIAIARAFVRNAPILVLDEPTAALDSKAEAEIQAAIDSLEQGRTVICIAHRLSTLATMDEIVVLNKGQIVERGTFDQLLKAKGHFARMAEQQRLTASS